MANELRVRQNFLGGLVEDAPLTAAATTLTSAALAAMVAIGSTQHLPITLDPDGLYGEPEIAYITAHTAAATTATILRAQEGSTARQHLQDVPWVHGPTSRDFQKVKSASRSSGDVVINSATWVNVDTGLDMTVDAQVGDVLECGLYFRAFVASTPTYLVLDFHTMVGGTPTNSIVTGAAPGTSPASSSPAWGKGVVVTVANGYSYFGGAHLYTVQAGDLASGAVTVRLRAVSGAAVTVNASDPALKASLKNLGSGA